MKDVIKRDLVDSVDCYLEQAIELAMTRFGITRDKATEVITKANEELDTKPDPMLQFNLADENRDSHPAETTFRNYLQGIMEANVIIAPSLSTYLKDESILVPEQGIVQEKMKSRSMHKKLLFKYKLERNKSKEEFHNTYQIAEKTVSNSISGGVSVGGSAVQNPASHSTLTSGARLSTSTPNSQIERLVTGDIHFKNLNSTLGYIGAILSHIRGDEVFRDRMALIIKQWALKIPNTDTVMAWIENNTRWYFNYGYDMLSKIVEGMSPLERAYLFYNGSLYALWEMNPELIKDLLSRLITKVPGKRSDNDVERISKIEELTDNTARHIHSERLKGVSDGYGDEGFDKDLLADILATAVNVDNVLLEFKPLLDMFLKPIVMMPNVGYYKECIRNAVVVNDTDSGIYHIGVWTEVMFGTSSIISPESKALCGAFTQLASLSFTHAMIHTSTNMNVKDPYKKTIDMKNEYTISMIGIPSGSKHYFMEVDIIEGNVLPTPKVELKGVGFKDASTPPIVKMVATSIERDIPRSIKEQGYVDIYKYLDAIVEVEKVLVEGAIENGLFYRSQDIKGEDSLIAPWKEFWNASPLHKRGEVEIPSTLIKMPTTLSTKGSTLAWLNSLDEEYSKPWLEWVSKHKPNGIPRVFLPADICLSSGIPDIFRPIIDTRGLVTDIAGTLYILLECLGIFIPPGVMLMDIYDKNAQTDFVTKTRRQ